MYLKPIFSFPPCLSRFTLSRSVLVLPPLHPPRRYFTLPYLPSTSALESIGRYIRVPFRFIRSVSQKVEAENEIERLMTTLERWKTDAEEHEGKVRARAEAGSGMATMCTMTVYFHVCSLSQAKILALGRHSARRRVADQAHVHASSLHTLNQPRGCAFYSSLH